MCLGNAVGTSLILKEYSLIVLLSNATHAATSLVRYELDTYPGSSGSPLLYSAAAGDSDIGIVIMAVHLHGATEKETKRPMFNEGSVLTKAVLDGMMATFYERH